MLELTKEKYLEEGLITAQSRSREIEEDVLFSYSFRFDIRDLLPILTHPSDKNTTRIYWEQPSAGLSFAGLGTVFQVQKETTQNQNTINEEIDRVMKMSVSVTENVLIGPRIIGGHAFNQY